MRCSFLLLSALSLLALVSQKAAADFISGSLLVNATVQGSCTAVTAPQNINFGVYNPAAPAADDATGAITITCTGGITEVDVGINAGSGAGASDSNPRYMTIQGGGGQKLAYSLFQDEDRTVVWGDTPGPQGNTKTLPVASGAANGTVYGRIAAQISPAPIGGTYQDTVTITATFTPL